MRNFKNHNLVSGQTLIEALIALGILGLITTSVLVLQQSGFNVAMRSSNRLFIVIAMRNMLVDAASARAMKSNTPKKITLQHPRDVELVYEDKKINPKSSLKDFKFLQLERVNASWHDGAAKQQDTMIALFFKPPESESKQP